MECSPVVHLLFGSVDVWRWLIGFCCSGVAGFLHSDVTGFWRSNLIGFQCSDMTGFWRSDLIGFWSSGMVHVPWCCLLRTKGQ